MESYALALTKLTQLPAQSSKERLFPFRCIIPASRDDNYACEHSILRPSPQGDGLPNPIGLLRGDPQMKILYLASNKRLH